MKHLFRLQVRMLAFVIAIFALNVLILAPQHKVFAGWVESYYCDPKLELKSFKNAQDMITDPYKDDDYGKKFLTDPNLDKYCIYTYAVGSLNDYKFSGEDYYAYCENALVSENGQLVYTQYVTALGIDEKKNSNANVDDSLSVIKALGGALACCPANAKYAKESWRTISCCSSNYDPENGVCADGTAVQNGQWSVKNALGDFAFPEAETIYGCPETSCFTSQDNSGKMVMLPDTTGRSNIHLADINYGRLSCVDPLSSDALSHPDKYVVNSSDRQYCYNGQLVTGDKIHEWGVFLNLYNSCQKIEDEDDQAACINCYYNCVKMSTDNTSCPIIYNSLGCIDSSANGIVTRVMQIGIGIIGAVGMIRIMQAAIMRQSGEPAKIKESYDIISSVIIGLIFIIFGVVILRFVGIQILPFDFLQISTK